MIETRQLCKRYGRFTAVDRIEFTVQPGQVLGPAGDDRPADDVGVAVQELRQAVDDHVGP